jgi:hypothetical protein
MATCKNCGKRLGCSCQVRTLANGQSGCTSCAGGTTTTTTSTKKTTTNNTVSIVGKAPAQFNVNGGTRYSNLNDYVPNK